MRLRVFFAPDAPPAGGGTAASGASTPSGPGASDTPPVDTGAAAAGGGVQSAGSEPDPLSQQVQRWIEDPSSLVGPSTKTPAAETTPPAETPPATPPATATPPAVDPRTAELERKLKEYEAFDPVVKQLKDAGYSSGEAVREALARQQEERQVQGKLAEIHDGLQQRVQAGEITPDQAWQLYQREGNLLQREISVQRAQQQSQMELASRQIASAVEKYPNLAIGRAEDGSQPGIGEAIVRSLHAAGYGEVHTLAGYVDQLITQATEKAVTDYAAKHSATLAATPPIMEGGAGGAPPATKGSQQTKGRSFAEILGIPLG